jgi:hypothetical protein
MRLTNDKGQELDFFIEVSKYAGHIRRSYLARHLAMYELYKKTMDLPGSIAEFGIFHGSTYFFLARLIEMFHSSQHERHSSSSRHLYGFDTFKGLAGLGDEDDTGVGMQHRKEGGFRGNAESFLDTFEQLKSDSTLKDRLHIVKGDVRETFPRFIEENSGVRLCMCLLDMDIYHPTKTVLDHILDIMVPGGVIIFDEYGFPEWPGETKAVDEFIRTQRLSLRSFPWTFSPSAYCMVP